MRSVDIEKILSHYRAYESDEKYSYRATFDEIKENDFNLNIPRYVDTFEEEPLVDIEEVQNNIKNIEAELSEVQKKMAEYLSKLWL